MSHMSNANKKEAASSSAVHAMEYLRQIVLPTTTGQLDTQHGSVLFIGTATVLFRYAGFTILTDPNFLHRGQKVHIGYGLRSERVTDPALHIEQLPPLDFILLSHLHEDHFDRVVERKLNKTYPIITNPKAATALSKKGFTRPYGINTWEALTVTKGGVTVRITSLPAKHAPMPLQLLLPPVMGSMLEFQPTPDQTRLRLYITGDTLLYKRLHEIPRRFSDIDLALIHLGGTKVMGVLLTMDGKQGAQALNIIAPRTAIPIHFNDYTVFKSPLDDFKKAVNDAKLKTRVRYLEHGETYNFEVKE